MIKQITGIAVLITTMYSVPAQAQFTANTATYTPTQLTANATALAAPALSTAIDSFEAAPLMGHPRLFKGQADYAGIIAATRAERLKSITAVTGYLKRNSVVNVTSALRTQINSADNNTRMASWWREYVCYNFGKLVLNLLTAFEPFNFNQRVSLNFITNKYIS